MCLPDSRSVRVRSPRGIWLLFGPFLLVTHVQIPPSKTVYQEMLCKVEILACRCYAHQWCNNLVHPCSKQRRLGNSPGFPRVVAAQFHLNRRRS